MKLVPFCITVVVIAAITCAAVRAQEVPGFGGTTVDADPFTQASQPIDLDRDGIADLVTIASEGTFGLCARRHLNDGSGRFTLTGFGKLGIDGVVIDTLVADVTGDGILDLIVLLLDGQVHVSRGDGVGGLTPTFNQATGLSKSREMAVGDIDGDGSLDLLVATPPQITALRGRGDGTFESGEVVATGSAYRSLAIADLDGDGVVDLLTADLPLNRVELLEGQGDGSFEQVGTLQVLQPLDLLLADFDGDDVDDLAVAGSGLTDAIRIFRGAPDGSFQPLSAIPTTTSFVLTAGDVDADGITDLVDARAITPFLAGDDVRTYLGQGDGTFVVSGSTDAFRNVRGLAACDLDGDLATDWVVSVAAVANGGSGIQIAHPRDGRLVLPTLDDEVADAVFTADLDGDGDEDVIAAGPARVTLHVVEAGEIVSRLDVVGEDDDFEPGSVIVADVDGDGLEDVVAGSAVAPEVVVVEQVAPGVFAEPVVGLMGVTGRVVDLDVLRIESLGSLVVALIEGDDGVPNTRVTFHAFAIAPFIIDVEAVPEVCRIATADLDDDGVGELVEAREDALVWQSYTFFGPGFYTPAVVSPLPSVDGAPIELLTADVDGDGVDELVYVTSDMVTVRRPSFTPAGVLFEADPVVDIVPPFEIAGVAALETGLDGAFELAVSAADRNQVDIYSPMSAGEPVRLLASTALAAGDVNGDGRDDLVTSGEVLTGGLAPYWITLHLRLDDIPWSAVSGGTAPLGESVPSLGASGDPSPGSPVRLVYEDGRPGAPVLLIVGLDAAFVPLQIGVVVPAPQLLVTLPPTDASGHLALDLTWSQLEPGLRIWAQAWQPAGPDTRASPGLTVVSR